jgi:hypothetical protein
MTTMLNNGLTIGRITQLDRVYRVDVDELKSRHDVTADDLRTATAYEVNLLRPNGHIEVAPTVILWRSERRAIVYQPGQGEWSWCDASTPEEAIEATYSSI